MSGRTLLRPAAAVALAGALLVLAVGARPGAAQSINVSGSTSLRFIELRTLATDSVAVGETQGEELLRQLPDGRIVRCVPGDAFCRFVRPGDRVSTVPLINDLDVSAWGLGRGVRLFLRVRTRTAWGGSPDLWPRADDAFDVLAAYGELERDRFRLRLGRQWKVSGLGFYNFDGVAAAVRPVRRAWIEGYAGRSLVRGLNEPRTGGALESIEALAPPSPGALMGLQARYRPTARLALSATYQVDFRSDGGGLYSELAAADGSLQVGGGSVESSVEVDAAAGALNEARLAARSPPWRHTALRAEVLRYRPYFELWTIWGAFSPVAFDEARGGLTWADSAGRVVLRTEASYRSYDDAGTDGELGAFRSRGWGATTGASWAPRPEWRLDGTYRVETGFGAARRDGSASATRRFGDAGSLMVQGLAFQRLYEFRLEEGTVVGLGAEGSLRISDRLSADGGVTVYRHFDAGPAAGVDWNQRRASLRLHWTLGPEPGAPRRLTRGRP
jgi:hypothetical protein